MLRLIVLSLAVLSCHALTDQEIALFYNDGCANGTVSVVRVSIRKIAKFMCSTMGRLQSGFNLITHSIYSWKMKLYYQPMGFLIINGSL